VPGLHDSWLSGRSAICWSITAKQRLINDDVQSTQPLEDVVQGDRGKWYWSSGVMYGCSDISASVVCFVSLLVYFTGIPNNSVPAEA
jgi:hypothetical protein